MSDDLERVAKAIFWSMNSIMHNHEKLWLTSNKKVVYLDVAHAAIAAMREPNDAIDQLLREYAAILQSRAEMWANAAFIVKAVNSHDALVKALERIARGPFTGASTIARDVLRDFAGTGSKT